MRADSDRLGQVLANLVENAASFATHRVEVGLAAGPGGAVLWVDDDGPGIPPDQLTRVFDRHVTTDREGSAGKGSGLGLAIVARTGHGHGGGGPRRVAARRRHGHAHGRGIPVPDPEAG